MEITNEITSLPAAQGYCQVSTTAWITLRETSLQTAGKQSLEHHPQLTWDMVHNWRSMTQA